MSRRESYEGFDLGRLRREINRRQGISNNEQIFASKGNPWRTTSGEERRAKRDRERLQYHLREANVQTEAQFIEYLRNRLSDPPPPERVKVDYKALSKQRVTDCSTLIPSRKLHHTKDKAFRQSLERICALREQLAHKQRYQTVKCSKTYKAHRHFTLEIAPLERTSANGTITDEEIASVAAKVRANRERLFTEGMTTVYLFQLLTQGPEDVSTVHPA